MDNPTIESKARELQLKIWENQHIYWPTELPSLLNMWDPRIAAAALSIQFEEYEELGNFGSHGSRFEIAGMLDRQREKIAVARKFGTSVARFTAAHEIGHWVLHKDQVMHRDRPIRDLANLNPSRPRIEREADYFAACFLMPRKLVQDQLEKSFGLKSPLVFNDNTAFWLSPDDPESLLRADRDRLDRALAVASARTYACRHFHSLASQFRVSPMAMAIRLDELNLIEW